MSKTFILILLVSAALAQTQLASSGTSTTITFPGQKKAVLTTHLNQQYPDVIPKAKWIWDNNGINTPSNDRLVAEFLFWAKCTGTITLSVAAYGNWWVYLDGSVIKSGSTWSNAQHIKFDPKCGNHNITFVVRKTKSDNFAGLQFLITQDTSKCRCNSNGFWNPKKCQCECLDKCPCSSNKNWKAYPTCACVCQPKKTISSVAIPRNLQVVASSRLSIAISLCPAGQYWDKQACQCKCTPKFCEANWYFVDDPADGCKCWPVIL